MHYAADIFNRHCKTFSFLFLLADVGAPAMPLMRGPLCKQIVCEVLNIALYQGERDVNYTIASISSITVGDSLRGD